MAHGPQELDPSKRAARDLQIKQMAFDGGLDMTQIAERTGLTSSRVAQVLGTSNARKDILELLEDTGPATVYNIRGIARELGMDINKAQYVVDNLVKRGYVTADRKSDATSGDHMAFTNIRLKKKRPHTPIVRDMSGPLMQEAIASVALDHGHLETQVVEEGAYTAVRPDLGPNPFAEVPVRDGVSEHLERLQIATRAGATTDEVAAGVVSLLKLEAVGQTEAVQEPQTIAAHEIPLYPLLWHLLDKDRKIQEAARLLEGAGLEDLALQALQKADDFTPLEREYMHYAAEHNSGE